MGQVAGIEALIRDKNPNNEIVDDLTGFVDLAFNGVSITLAKEGNVYTPQYLQYFEMKRMVNGLGMFTITLVDPEWVVIENLLLNSAKEGNKVSLRYGMMGLSENRNTLPFMDVKVLQYELDPYLDYCIVTVRGLALGYDLLGPSLVGTNAKVKTVLEGGLDARSTTSISEYVKDLAISLGYTDDKSRNIDPTSVPFTKADLGTTADVAGIKSSDNATALSFLIEKLVTKANSTDNDKSPFVFFISKRVDAADSKDETTKVKDSKAATNNIKEVFNFCRMSSNVSGEPKASYTLFSDRNSHVISFKPSYSNSIVNIAQGNTVLAYGYDSFTGEEFGKVEGSPVVPSPDVVDPKSVSNTPKVIQYIPGPVEYVSQRLSVVAANLAMSPITAELTVVGDVSFEILDCIDIFVNIPAGPISVRGTPHNTSGRYMILGIVDKIDGGVFETSLHLGSAFSLTPTGKAKEAASKIIISAEKAAAELNRANKPANSSPDKPEAKWVMPPSPVIAPRG